MKGWKFYCWRGADDGVVNFSSAEEEESDGLQRERTTWRSSSRPAPTGGGRFHTVFLQWESRLNELPVLKNFTVDQAHLPWHQWSLQSVGREQLCRWNSLQQLHICCRFLVTFIPFVLKPSIILTVNIRQKTRRARRWQLRRDVPSCLMAECFSFFTQES